MQVTSEAEGCACQDAVGSCAADCSGCATGGKRAARLYGGTERVVAWLTDELVELGHDVTLFASGDAGAGLAAKPAAGTLEYSPPRCGGARTKDGTGPDLLDRGLNRHWRG